MYYAKCLAEKGLVFWASPLSLYIFRHCALPSLCEASHNDGLGEGFEQREIKVGDCSELYVHLWHSEGWSLQTEQEQFGPKFADGLPEMCFSTLRDTGELICIKRGESGYYRSDWNTSDRVRNQEIAEDRNRSLGVTEAQRKAMEAGSMFGWSCPGADPKTYGQTAGQPQMADTHRGGMDLA